MRVNRTTSAIALASVLALGAAACGEDADPVQQGGDEMTDEMTDDEMSDEMADDEMSDEMADDEMTDDEMTDEMTDEG